MFYMCDWAGRWGGEGRSSMAVKGMFKEPNGAGEYREKRK